MYSRLAGVGNLIPQSIADYIEDMAQENYAVRVKEVGTGIAHYGLSPVTPEELSHRSGTLSCFAVGCRR
jgi:hypothetical protein